jgi:FADH2 O2-dependent halogenase
MKTIDVDVVVLGSGFAGSLTAMLLRRIGRTVALIDKGRHPRFAIGESSTPIANMVLRDLALRYDLARLVPLCKYGSWRETYPELTCGLKRGFSYFAHEPNTRFQPSSSHHNELLVAASADDAHSDTQWLRSDIDAFLCREAADAGAVVLEETRILELESAPSLRWSLRCLGAVKDTDVRCNFLIDATGEAGVVPRSLGIDSEVDRFHTHSRAIFSHFVGVHDWRDVLHELGGHAEDHPFPCDHAAQHHLLDGAWLWLLRFQSSPSLPSTRGEELERFVVPA